MLHAVSPVRQYASTSSATVARLLWISIAGTVGCFHVPGYDFPLSCQTDPTLCDASASSSNHSPAQSSSNLVVATQVSTATQATGSHGLEASANGQVLPEANDAGDAQEPVRENDAGTPELKHLSTAGTAAGSTSVTNTTSTYALSSSPSASTVPISTQTAVLSSSAAPSVSSTSAVPSGPSVISIRITGDEVLGGGQVFIKLFASDPNGSHMEPISAEVPADMYLFKGVDAAFQVSPARPPGSHFVIVGTENSAPLTRTFRFYLSDGTSVSKTLDAATSDDMVTYPGDTKVTGDRYVVFHWTGTTLEVVVKT
jgi:hypothetical protein